MDGFESLAKSIVSPAYISQGLQGLRGHRNLLKVLLSHRRLPEEGWSDQSIEFVISEFAMMDSNNFLSNTGVGEREGRVFSSLVARRHHMLSHGIGRSGDLDEVQPKAAGSSLLYKLTMSLTLHALRVMGLEAAKRCLVVPLATGMSLSLCLLTLKKANPAAKYVIWSRIDQKSCLKSISTAGLIPLVAEGLIEGDSIVTNITAIEELLTRHTGEVLCVLSTTSCFAPRRPDRVDVIAKLCATTGVGHVVNNAYGLQCPGICRLLNRAAVIGRLDYIVSSTDKNFMVPVGGAIIYSPDKSLIDAVSKMYPGRASMSPVLDLFMTLLSMGEAGLKAVIAERLRLLPLLVDGMQRVASSHGERVLISTRNSISIAATLDGLSADAGGGGGGDSGPSFLGSMLFQRCVSGTRVVTTGEPKTVAGIPFRGWGSSASEYPYSYFTAACAVGLTEKEVNLYLTRLDAAFKEFKKKRVKKASIGSDGGTASVSVAPVPSDLPLPPATASGTANAPPAPAPAPDPPSAVASVKDKGLIVGGVGAEEAEKEVRLISSLWLASLKDKKW